jgi:hypothetical protein
VDYDRPYRILAREDDVRIELHVLARAYQEAYWALTQRLPHGRHHLEDLGVTFHFGKTDAPG